jgi:hypothetical protein
MGHKIVCSNYRVEVEPEEPYLPGKDLHAAMVRQCEDLRADIRRHCDGIKSAITNYDRDLVCEHCGVPWTEGKDSPHNGGCCDTDGKVYEQLEPEAFV